MPQTMDEYINSLKAQTYKSDDLKREMLRAFNAYLTEGRNRDDIILENKIELIQKKKLNDALDDAFKNPKTKFMTKLSKNIEQKIKNKLEENKEMMKHLIDSRHNNEGKPLSDLTSIEESKLIEEHSSNKHPGVKAPSISLEQIIEDYKNNPKVILNQNFRDEFLGKFKELKEDSLDELIENLNKESIREEFVKSLENSAIKEDSKSKMKELNTIIEKIKEKNDYQTDSEAEDSDIEELQKLTDSSKKRKHEAEVNKMKELENEKKELEKKEQEFQKASEENRKKMEQFIKPLKPKLFKKKKREDDEELNKNLLTQQKKIKQTPLEEYSKKVKNPLVITEMKELNPESKLLISELNAENSISEEEKKKNLLEAEIRLGVEFPKSIVGTLWGNVADYISDRMKAWNNMPATYRWLGPGTDIRRNLEDPKKGEPINELDRLGAIHDLTYEKISHLDEDEKYKKEKSVDKYFIEDMNNLKNTLEKRILHTNIDLVKKEEYKNEIKDIITAVYYMEQKKENSWLPSFVGSNNQLSAEELKEKKREFEEKYTRKDLKSLKKEINKQDDEIENFKKYIDNLDDYIQKNPLNVNIEEITDHVKNLKKRYLIEKEEINFIRNQYFIENKKKADTPISIDDILDELQELKVDMEKARSYYLPLLSELMKEQRVKPEYVGKVHKQMESGGMVVPVASTTKTETGNVGNPPPALALPTPAPVVPPPVPAIGTPPPRVPRGYYRAKKINIAGMGQLTQDVSKLTEEELKAKEALDTKTKEFVKLDSVRYTDKVVTGERSMRALVDKRLGAEYVKLTPEEKERNIAFYSNLNFVKEGNGNGNQQLLPFSYKGWKAKNKLFDVSKLEEKLRFSGKLNVGNQYVQPRAEPTFQMRQMKEPLMFPQDQVNQRLFPVNPYAECSVGRPIMMSNERQNDFNYSSGSNYAKNSTLYFQNYVNNGFKL